ncbi:MAG: tyrosine--tRNA ligase [Candidatus Heimdallarchaeota archaeon]
MDTESVLDVFRRRPTEEILTEDDLREMIESGVPLKHYIGFEISGKITLGTGIGCMMKVADLSQIGVSCTIFLADYHSFLNNKLGGEWDNIRRASEYFREGMLGCIKALGGKLTNIQLTLGSELYHHNDDYWRSVLEISKHVSIGRIMRSITILGRKEKELTSFAQLIYPPMQVADIFAQDVNIAHAGIDQRKAHVIAREVGLKVKRYKPIALHHHLLLGLQKPGTWPIPDDVDRQNLWSEMKMSKSRPETAIFVTDSKKTIQKRFKKAFCPEKIADFNPVLDWAKHIILRTPGSFLEVTRPSKFGGDITFSSYEELEEAFVQGKLHPADLKQSVAERIGQLLEPVRAHFAGKENLIELIETFSVTR